ncbi:MAG: bifunctional phosphoribosylaminoimidazolecarboxamide formyltransferase/inosine monophosphate cyclohydrolase [Pelagibacterales bacterium]|nr:bifunctional phosphoribosylaminoimidazolecarboxamide formyltransferase/inosine monophosphate cyclohydrolase [Pelagibacterales bacterium]PPR15820.1 MAG: Bifunctional purine biosynthesis protein PurH [Alphaproteobacteria bacterium MarineAlpha9_Bin3]|tara:strand:+ start:16380 stop:17966 length:1587 start_codon:yes stop_codon:yes gene_type:complete
MTSNIIKIEKALISLSDKSNIEVLIKIIKKYNIEVLSTGGTANLLREQKLNVKDVSDYTNFPEMLDGRVKTLHPKIHGGLLGRTNISKHKQEMKQHSIEPINLVIVNLYPFSEAVKNNLSFEECIENIDIGGPSMIRSAAKNHENVCVVTNPEDYIELENILENNSGGTSLEDRKIFAAKAFSKTAFYDSLISQWFNEKLNISLPKTITISGELVNQLRYGENPHQKSAVYKKNNQKMVGVVQSTLLQGKPLSYNNLNDSDAAYELIKEFNKPTIAIIKHANPCGVSSKPLMLEAWKSALQTDPQSAFGGIVASNREITKELAEKMNEIFLEVIIAPSFSKDSLSIFATKKNLRLLKVRTPDDSSNTDYIIKDLSDGFLVQDKDSETMNENNLNIVTNKKPSSNEIKDLIFAFKVAKHVKSNAIIYAKNNATVGIGAGQMSRIDSSQIAAIKSKKASKLAGLKNNMAEGSVLASDAFFPFADGLIAAAEAGVTSIIQPGGSIRDEEVIEAANKLNLSMIFTGIRHFRH